MTGWKHLACLTSRSGGRHRDAFASAQLPASQPEQMSRPPARDAGLRPGAREQRQGRSHKPQPFAGLVSGVPHDAAPLQLTVFGLPADLHVRRSAILTLMYCDMFGQATAPHAVSAAKLQAVLCACPSMFVSQACPFPSIPVRCKQCCTDDPTNALVECTHGSSESPLA